MTNYYPSFIPQPYRRPLTGVIVVVVLAVIIYFIGKSQGWWGKAEKGADEVSLDPSKPAPKKGFNATNEAVKLFGWLTSFDVSSRTSRTAAFTALLAYSDNELKAVHNAWVNKYREKSDFWAYLRGYNTLRKQVEAEQVFPDEKPTKESIIDRLNKLGL